MIKPKRMKKIRVIVLKSQVENLIRSLHEAGIVDIRKTEYGGLEAGRPLASFEELSAELLKLRTILTIMEANIRDSGKPGKMDGQQALEKSKSLELDKEIKAINKKMTELAESIKTLESQQKTIEKISDFKFDFSRSETKTLTYSIGETSKADILKGKIEKLDVHATVVAKGSIALIVYEKKAMEKIETIVGEIGFSEFELPDYTTSPKETLANIANELEAQKAGLAELKKKIDVISGENINMIKTLLAALEIEAARAEITTRFSNSRYIFVLEGWVLADEYNHVKTIIDHYKGDAELVDIKYGHDETPPTVLENKQPVAPFEFITKSYSFPKYNELDPTLPFFFFLSIIYGMIVGDVGYGIISIILSVLILRKYSHNEILRNIAMIWIVGSVPTMIFGIIYDEWLGLTHFMIFEWLESWTGIMLISAPLYSGFHRVHELGLLLLITLFVGMFHLGVGLILGFISEWNHNRKHAYAKLGWLGLLLGIVIIALMQIGFLPEGSDTAGIALAVIGIIVVAVTEGAVGVVEIPGFAGNIMSYVRIGVIGVVGVILAEIINDFLRPQPGMGIVALLILPIYLVLQVANCVIAMFEALVQGGRLNIFEFRTKFIHGGGKVFDPFMLKK
ncbi:hypothetical protein JXA56_00335 [Candidatus Micrarchaeota archaeon]|nr:hypothetical protein [Candidatus Micrarchaeota archaeon]